MIDYYYVFCGGWWWWCAINNGEFTHKKIQSVLTSTKWTSWVFRKFTFFYRQFRCKFLLCRTPKFASVLLSQQSFHISFCHFVRPLPMLMLMLLAAAIATVAVMNSFLPIFSTFSLKNLLFKCVKPVSVRATAHTTHNSQLIKPYVTSSSLDKIEHKKSCS